VHGRGEAAHAIWIPMWPGECAQGVGVWRFGGLSVGVSGNGCSVLSASILIAASGVSIASYASASTGVSASRPCLAWLATSTGWPGPIPSLPSGGVAGHVNAYTHLL
jgi:hypothetical protein